MTKIRAIAYDLDDTLLDTSNLLVPRAAEQACQAMLDAGLRCTLDQCLTDRQALSTSQSHTEIFSLIANKYGTNQKGRAVHDALEKFYNPEIPTELPVMPGALENIDVLRKNGYKLYLVTMGSFEAQVRKIKAMNIEKLFDKVFILNGFIGEKKESAFREILKTNNLSPEQLLTFGNRLSVEIRDGKRCGAQTCYFAYGEHVGELPLYPEDHPDFTITEHKEFISTCGL